ncbi:MAG: DUF3500 domain-containing protein, partial [Planctomycetes bacterium]|nr:DUF3500 domain-containing protein [Planctomycetota bacterium]
KLSKSQVEKASFAYDDKDRLDWPFIPRPRKGLPLSEMDEAQKKLVRGLLLASLGETGLKTTEDVRSLEGILRAIEGPTRRFRRDPEHYYLSVIGSPGGRDKWGWRFEGHHLCVNFTLHGKSILAATPLFFGANPGEVKSGPRKGLRVLGSVEDLGRTLMKSLDDSQLKTALGKGKPEEVKATQAASYNAELPAGLSASKMHEGQVKTLTSLVLAHTRNMEKGLRKGIENSLAKGNTGKIQGAWRGNLEAGKGHSYIVQCPDFIISYSNFQNNAAHVHSSLRASKGEFGLGAE